MSRYGEPGAPYDPPSDPWGQGGGDLTAPTPGYAPGPPGYPPEYPADAPPGYPPEYPADAPPGYPHGPPPDYPPGPAQGGWDPNPGPAWQADPAPPWSADPEPGWGGADPEPPSRRRSALLFLAVGVLVLVVAGAVGYALYLLSGDGEPSATGTETRGPASTGQATPPGTPEPGSTQNNIGLNAAMAREGDCLTNLGTEVEPQLQIVPCDSDENGPVYQVLAKVDSPVEGDDRSAQDASAQQLCGGTEGYTHHYFEISDSLSFVLCMAERELEEEQDE